MEWKMERRKKKIRIFAFFFKVRKKKEVHLTVINNNNTSCNIIFTRIYEYYSSYMIITYFKVYRRFFLDVSPPHVLVPFPLVPFLPKNPLLLADAGTIFATFLH